MIRDKESQANQQLELQRQSLEQYKMRVENELQHLSRETQNNVDKEQTMNKQRDDFEFMRTQHVSKLNDREKNLSQKEETLH